MPKKIKSNVEKIRSIPKDKPKKKYLRKNEIRRDLNPEHYNKYGSPHIAYITVRLKHKLKANTKTHAEFVNGVKTLDLQPELPDNVKHERISPPYWQNENQFSERIGKEKVPKSTLRKIQKYNKKFDI